MAKKIHKRKKDGCDDERHDYLDRNRQGHIMVLTERSRALHECTLCGRRAFLFNHVAVLGMSSDPCPYGDV